MEVNLGRVVGSKIRNGNEMPTDYNGWLDGDIFILNGKEIKYFEYRKQEEQLVLLGILSGPQGPVGPQGPAGTDAEHVRKINITREQFDETYGEDTTPTWSNIIQYIDTEEGGVNGNEIIFLTFENSEQDEVNYLIFPVYNLHSNTICITNFREFVYFETYENYKSLDLHWEIKENLASKQYVEEKLNKKLNYYELTNSVANKDIEAVLLYCFNIIGLERPFVINLTSGYSGKHYSFLGCSNISGYPLKRHITLYDIDRMKTYKSNWVNEDISSLTINDIIYTTSENLNENFKENNYKLYYDSIANQEHLGIFVSFFTNLEINNAKDFIEQLMPNGIKSATGSLFIDDKMHIVYGLEKTIVTENENSYSALKIYSIEVTTGNYVQETYDYAVLTLEKQ